MRSDLVVLPKPNIDSDLGLSCGAVWCGVVWCGVEPFCVEDFFSQGAVKAFVVSIFPRSLSMFGSGNTTRSDLITH